MRSRTWIDAALNDSRDYGWDRLFTDTWMWTVSLPGKDNKRALSNSERNGDLPEGYFRVSECGLHSAVRHARRIKNEHGVLTVWVEFNSEYEPVQFDGEMFIGADAAPFLTVEDFEKEMKRIYNLR